MSAGEEEATGGPVELIGGDGLLIAASVEIICLGCNNRIVANLINENLDEPNEIAGTEVGCRSCSGKLGKRVSIPVVVLTGSQVAEYLDEVDEEGEGAPELEAPALPAAAPPAEAPPKEE